MPGGTSKVTEKGQVTIPSDLRERFKIGPGTTVVFVEVDGVITLRTLDDIKDLFRRAHQEVKELGITRADLKKAVQEARKETSAKYAAKYGLARRR